MKQFFHHRTTLTSLFILFFTITLTAQQQEHEEYWSLVPGMRGDHLVMLDSTVVLVSADWDKDTVNYYFFRSIIHLHHFDMEGTFINSHTFNINDTEWLLMPEFMGSLSRHKVHRLQNGNFLIGGHGRVVSPDDKTYPGNRLTQDAAQKWTLPLAYDHGTLKDTYPMVHPLIATFNPTLDSLLRIDTLAAVPGFGNVTLIHEVAPDTLIISYHKSYPSNQVILETDSLFNVRWMSEDFGHEDYWIADIHDFLVTPEGDYLVSMQYFYEYTANSLGYNKNILFKFDKATGELLWEEEIWTDKGQNTSAAMAPWQDDKFVIALDDCCKHTNPFHEIIFHNYTGMHLQVRDYDGMIHQEISLRDFLWTFVKVFPGPSAYGGDLEDPDDAAPWFVPYQIIRNPDGTYLVTGIQYTSHWMIFGRGFLLKLGTDLQPLWARIYEIDKKNYEYGVNYAFIFNVVNTGSQIFLGGSFVTAGFWSTDSPFYPPNYQWDFYFRKDLLIALDEYGCYEPGCHLTDNVPYYELEQAITLVPNPARERVHIRIDHPALAHKEKVLFISNMQGQGMLTQRFSGSSIEVSLVGYTPGTYLVYIMSEGQVF
ncbi:MAG: T9SS type A sorting domain-containing protein, partial [Bacteroidota bacterium]